MRRAAKRDTSEAGIVLALRQAGALVLVLDVFDLLVYFRGDLYMLDAKTGKGKATASQDRLIALGWPLSFVRNPLDALMRIGAVK